MKSIKYIIYILIWDINFENLFICLKAAVVSSNTTFLFWAQKIWSLDGVNVVGTWFLTFHTIYTNTHCKGSLGYIIPNGSQKPTPPNTQRIFLWSIIFLRIFGLQFIQIFVYILHIVVYDLSKSIIMKLLIVFDILDNDSP